MLNRLGYFVSGFALAVALMALDKAIQSPRVETAIMNWNRCEYVYPHSGRCEFRKDVPHGHSL